MLIMIQKVVAYINLDVVLFKSIDGRNRHYLKGAMPLSLQNLLNTLNLAFISFARDDLSVCAGANTNVRCNARHAIGVNSRVAIVDGPGNL